MRLEDFRKQYPQYNDISDEDLARGLHRRFYSDIPFEDFSQRIGFGPESGDVFVPALKSGVSLAQEAGYALAGRTGLMDEAAAQKAIEEEQAYQQRVFKPTEEGFLEAPVTKTLELLGQSLPFMALPVAAAGAALTLPFTGPAATVAALGAAGLASGAQFTGTNLLRQMEPTEDNPRGKSIGETDLGNAALAAVPQAALDVVSFRMMPFIRGVFGQAGKTLTEKEAQLIASKALKDVAADYALATGKTMTVEGLTEAAQQSLERLQAGLNITDQAARDEYLESFIGGAVLGGVLAPPGRYLERRAAQQAQQPEAEPQTEPTPPPAGVPPGAVIPEEEALTPEEEAEFQARLAAAPPAAPVAVQPQPQPPLPPAPAAVQPPVTPAPVEQVVEEEEVIEVPPTVEQIAQQAPVTPQTKSLTDQLAQVRAARMDPMLTPDDPAFQELDRREQEILGQIEQLSVQPGQLAPSVQAGQLPPPAEPSVQVGQLPQPSFGDIFTEPVTPTGQTVEDQIRAQKAEERRERQAAQEAKKGEFVLQNRDRSSTASLEQMEKIASEPDYGRAGFSRTPDGAPIIAYGDFAPEQLGREDVVTTARGRKIPIQYAVVEADEVITSNDMRGTPDTRYGNKEVPGPRAIAGNGRITGLQEAFNRGTATPYVEQMEGDASLHGVSPDVIASMKKPILVRVMPQEGLTRDIGDELNMSSMLELSPVEQARNDLNRVDLEALEFGEDGEVTNASLGQFINAQPIEERAKLVDRGLPTKQARQRLENAIFAQAYNDDDLIAMFAQTDDPEAKLVVNALAQVAPQMAQLEGAGDLDIRDIVTDAAKIIISGKRRGLKMREIATQVDMTVDPDTRIIVELFAANPRSNKGAIEALRNAATTAYNESLRPEEGLFGVEPKMERREIVERMRRGDEPTRTEDVAAAQRPGPAPSDVERQAEPSPAAVPPQDQGFELRGQTPEELAELQRRELSGEAEAERERLEAEEAARAAAEAERKIADQKRETFELAPPPSAPTARAAAPSGDLFGTAGITEQPTRAPRRVGAELSPIEAAAEDAREAEELGPAQKVLDEFVESISRGSGKRRFETPDETTILTEETWDGDTTLKRVEFDAIVSLATKTDSKRGAKYSILIKNTPTESITLTFQPRGLKPLDRRVDVNYVYSKTTLDTDVPPLEDAITERMRQLGVADFDDASKKVQEAYGVSKPVADAYIRAVRKQAEAIAKISYGKAPSSDFQEAYDEAQKLLNRIKGISKRKEAEAEKPKDDVQTRTIYRTGPSFMDDLGPNVTAADVVRYEQEELGNQDLRVVTDADLSKISTSKLEWVTFDRKDAEQYLPEDADPEDTTEITSRKETFRVLAQDSDGGYLIERVSVAEVKPKAKKEEKPAEVQTWDVFYTGTTNLAAENVEAPSAQKAKEIAAEKEGLKSIARLTAKKKDKKLTGAYVLAIREQNAADKFIDSVMEQFGLTKAQAQTALNRLLKEKVVSLDPVVGQFKLKDGRFWDKEVMRRAAGLEETEQQAKVEEPKVKEEKVAPKKEEDQFVRGTEEQLKAIRQFAKRYGDSDVAYYDPDKDIGLVISFGLVDGDPKYIPYVKGVYARFPLDIESARLPDVQPYKAELIEVKERLEKAAAKKHQENPFIKFDKGIALSDGIDPKIEGIIREWKDMLGLGNINIYFSTTEDAKKNINKFTGPHRRIGSATIDPNERGSARRMEGGASYYVVFDKSTSTSKMLEVIAHEIGHVHEKAAFDRAPQELKDKLQAAHKKWLEGRKDKTSREAIEMLRAKTTAQTTGLGQTIETAEQLDKLSSYWSSFSEWYADQVSRWAVTDEKPVGVVEKFFARLGAALRRFYQGLKGQGYLPDETFVQYLKQVKPTIVETIPGPVKDPVNQDMSSKMQADLFGSPKEAKDIGEAMEVKGKKLPPGRSPELTAAAQAVKAGTMTAEEYNKLVDIYKPIPLYAEPLKPATSEQVFDALDVKKREQINPEIPNGTKVGLRLDIPAFNRKGVFVVSIHQKRTASAPGKVIGYGSVAKAKNVTFGVGNQLKALEIAAGSAKDALQTMEGEYVNTTPEQAFAEAQRAIKDPNYVQIGIDPTRHAYFYDRRTTLPVVAAEEVIQIGNMILAKKPTFGSKSDFLYNIDASEVAGDTQSADMSFLDRLRKEDSAKRDQERKESIAYYASIRRKQAELMKQVAQYGSTLDIQRQLTNLNEIAKTLKEDIDLDRQPTYSAENFMRQARAALDGTAPYKEQAIDPDVFAVIQAVYMDDPKLLEGLRLSIKPEFNARDEELRKAFGLKASAGAFETTRRIVHLYTGTKGVREPSTIRHELVHTLEQMMTGKQRQAVINSYLNALQKAIRQNKDPKAQKFFENVLAFHNNPSEKAAKEVERSLPSLDLYQFVNASEYWAVNAEKLMAQRLGVPWDRFKKAVRKIFQKLKSFFGFDDGFAVHEVFDQIMAGSKKRLDRESLAAYMGAGNGEFTFLKNIQEETDLMIKSGRADTPMLDHAPAKRLLFKGVQMAKDEYRFMVENPSSALGMFFNSVNRGISHLRNKFVWFGTGLNEADRIRYNGEIRTANGEATASLALDNMIRGGNISTQVLFLGGLEYNPKTLQYTAVRKEKNMTKAYEAEARLKEKLGDQLGTNIFNAYGEAKRSLSMKNEVVDRKKDYEQAEQELDDAEAIFEQMKKDPNVTEEEIEKFNRELRKLFIKYRDARKSYFDMVKLVEEKVTMPEDQIKEFIALENKHPELKEILDNFNAVNQNLLRVWRDVGLISEGRYKVLSSIKDYVPWYRIMNDDADIHDPVQSTTRTATNIGREKLFRSGTPSVTSDFIIEEEQKSFRVPPGRVNTVKLGNTRLRPNQYEVTPQGELTLKVDYQPGQVLVVETQREIENMIDNMTRNIMRMSMNAMRKHAANRIVSEYAMRDANGRIMTFKKADVDKGRMDYIQNGRRTVIEIPDPLIAQAMLGMETVGMDMVWEPLAAAANFTRRTITLSPVFQLKQVFKDAPTAALVTGVKNPGALIGGVYKGFIDAVRDTDPAGGILRSAGIGGFYSPARTPEADVKRQIGIINNNTFDYVMKALDHWGDSSDMAQRIAIYNRVMKETGDEALAMYQASNVINFLRHGSGSVAIALTRTVPFLNAYAQSIDVLYNALIGGGLRGMDRTKALRRLAFTGSLMAGTVILYTMLVGDDDDYQKLDDQTKVRNIIIPGTDVILPMNTSAAFFFKAIPELIVNKIINEGTANEVDAARLRTALKESAIDLLLGPTPIPSAVKPFIEISLDYNFFTSRPITPRGMENLDAYQQYDMRTSEAAKLLSGLTGTEANRLLNPMEADHLVRSIFGTAGAMVAWSSNVIGEGSSFRPEMTIKEFPVVGAFLRPEVPRGREDLFYRLKDATDRKYNTFNRIIQRGDFAEADRYLQRYPNLIAYYDYTTQMANDLKDINSAIRFIAEVKDPSYTAERKRTEIQELMVLKQEVLEGIEQFRKEAYAE